MQFNFVKQKPTGQLNVCLMHVCVHTELEESEGKGAIHSGLFTCQSCRAVCGAWRGVEWRRACIMQPWNTVYRCSGSWSIAFLTAIRKRAESRHFEFWLSPQKIPLLVLRSIFLISFQTQKGWFKKKHNSNFLTSASELAILYSFSGVLLFRFQFVMVLKKNGAGSCFLRLSLCCAVIVHIWSQQNVSLRAIFTMMQLF